MTIEIIVRNYRGITSADIECAPIALLAGQNGAGKSSIAEAAAACLTGAALAAKLEMDKKEAGEVVRTGATAGVARVVRKEDGQEPAMAQVSWPECQLQTTGAQPPHASSFAVGQMHALLHGRAADRAAIIQHYLKSSPTKADLHEAMMAAADFADEAVEKLWADIGRLGWDSAAVAQETLRREANQQWARVTGTAFGSEKARNWRPDGWDILLDGKTPEQIEQMIAAERAALEEALKVHAVDEAEAARLRALADQVDSRRQTLAEAQRIETNTLADLNAAMEARKGLPVRIAAAGFPCPHCGERVMVIGEGAGIQLAKFEGVTPEENKRRDAAISQANLAITDATAAKDKAVSARVRAEADLQAAEDAAQKLTETAGNIDAGRVERLRTAVRQRENEYRMVTTAAAARKHYLAWLSANIKFGLLSPAGLRAKKLAESIAAFNKVILAPLATVAEWALVELADDLTLRAGGRRYGLLSSGEQWRVRVILQAAFATLDGSDLVIVDDTPDLDDRSRNGLYWLIQDTKLHALICMATLPGIKVPDLAAAGLGRTYMIVDQTAHLINGASGADA